MYNYHIISISATWLNPSIPNSLVNIDGFYLLRNDRTLCEGGGVARYIHESLITNILSLSCNTTINDPKFVIMKVSTASQDNLLFSSIYRRPKRLLFNTFISEFSKYYSHFQNVILAGQNDYHIA